MAIFIYIFLYRLLKILSVVKRGGWYYSILYTIVSPSGLNIFLSSLFAMTAGHIPPRCFSLPSSNAYLTDTP